MIRVLKRLFAIALAVVAVGAPGWFAHAGPTAADERVDFARDVYPILARSCHGCHGPAMQMARLRLDSKLAAFAGGQSGPVIQPGRSAESVLYRRVAGLGDQPRMPVGREPLGASEIQLLATWIDQGADWPDLVGASSSETKPHWAFIPPRRPALPPVRNSGWARNAIDRFVLARLEQEGLSPSPEADR